MPELDQIGVVNGIPNSGTGEVPTLAVVRDKLDEVLSATTALGSAGGAIAVTPNDDTELDDVRAVFIGTGGTLVATIGGVDFTFNNIPDGTTLPIKVTKIKAATTAEDIVALT